MLQTINYSIIIPHYNSPKVLARMLSSIPQRDDIEIIVVDDGSDDVSKKELALLSHKNLTVIYNPINRNAGYARNTGLGRAVGKWILVVDSDDKFSDNAFDVFDTYKESDYDYIGFVNKIVDENLITLDKKIKSKEAVKRYLHNPDEKGLRYLKYGNTVCWNKMVSASFIKKYNIKFEDCKVNNDVLYALSCGLYAKNFKIIDQELYVLIMQSHSITRKQRDIEREFVFYLQAQKRNGFYRKLGIGFPLYRYDWMYFMHLLRKRGINETIKFFKIRYKKRCLVDDARKEYLYLFNQVD